MADDAVSNTVAEKRVGSSPTTDTKEILDLLFQSTLFKGYEMAFTTSGSEALSLYDNKGKLHFIRGIL